MRQPKGKAADETRGNHTNCIHYCVQREEGKEDTCKKNVLYYHLQKIIGNELKQFEPKETTARNIEEGLLKQSQVDCSNVISVQ